MIDRIYIKMLLKRRLCKRLIVMVSVFAISFYISLFLFGDLKTPKIMNLTDLDRCPACYGVSVCPELYSNQIILDSHSWGGIFNAKNIYYGYTKSNRRVILKKLAHDRELKDFDSQLCNYWNLNHNCKPINLLDLSNVNEKVIDIIKFNLTLTDIMPRKGLVMCPYAYSYYDFIQPILDKGNKNNYQSEIINVWTMITINPEPIILQILQKSKGWPVPAYGGVCGRLEVVAYEGEPLSQLMHITWHKKLLLARKILNAAMDFTFKHDRFRFYLMDWSIDNIVANEKDEITFVDLEDIIVLDKHISPRSDLPKWYQRYTKENVGLGFAFSIRNMCKHHLSDHNVWAACYILAGEENAFLYPFPKEVNVTRPHFESLLNKCLYGNNRLQVVTKLQQVMDEMLIDEKVLGYGVK